MSDYTIDIKQESNENLVSIAQAQNDSIIKVDSSINESIIAVSALNEEEAVNVEQLSEELIDINQESEDNISDINILSEDEPTIIPMTDDIIIHKGYSPFINKTTMTWFEYDNQLKAFVDTGISVGGGGEYFEHKYLHIGSYDYNGSKEVTVPVYNGNMNNESGQSTATQVDSQISTLSMSINPTNTLEMTINSDKTEMILENKLLENLTM